MSIANAYFRDVRYLVGVVLNVVFFLVPIVYPLSIIPDEQWGLPLLDLMKLNPLFHFVAASQQATYFGVVSWGRLAFIGAVSVVIFLAGWTFFVRKSVDIAEEL